MTKFYTSKGSEELDFESIDRERFTHVWYRYFAGTYDGSGYAIALDNNGRWYQADLGHCSCYGPEDSFNSSVGYGSYNSLEDLWENVTDEVKEMLKPLIEEFNIS